MTNKKRKIEVFTAGCPVCDDALAMVMFITCPSCDLEVVDMKTPAGAARARSYGIQRLSSVVVDGKIAGCCSQGPVDVATLRDLGVGVAA